MRTPKKRIFAHSFIFAHFVTLGVLSEYFRALSIFFSLTNSKSGLDIIYEVKLLEQHALLVNSPNFSVLKCCLILIIQYMLRKLLSLFHTLFNFSQLSTQRYALRVTLNFAQVECGIIKGLQRLKESTYTCHYLVWVW